MTAVAAWITGVSATFPWEKVAVVLAAYLVCTMLSGVIVKAALRWTRHDLPLSDTDIARSGKLIGKCENVLVVTLVILDALTAIALIFTAKSLIRKDQVQDAEYFLGGTLVNVTWSLLVALPARWLIQTLP